MDRRHIVVKAALLAAGIALLPVHQAAACGYGYYYYPGYGCRAYDYGFPAGALGGLLFGLLARHRGDHGYSGDYRGGGGLAGAIARHGASRGGGGFAGVIERHGGGHTSGFGGSAPHAAAPHAEAHAGGSDHGGDHKK